MKSLTSYVNFTIAQYIIEPIKELDDWLHKYKNELYLNKLTDYEYLYCRDNINFYRSNIAKNNTIMAKVILKNNINNIFNLMLSANKSKWAYNILKNNKSYCDSDLLSKNTSKYAGKLIKNILNEPNSIIHIDNCWGSISANPSRWAYKILLSNPKNIIYGRLLENNSNWARKLLPEKININWYLSSNNAIWAGNILKNNINAIDWDFLSANSSSWAVELLLRNSNEIKNEWLCAYNTNKLVGQYLKHNMNEINWFQLCYNSSKWAYELLKKNSKIYIWEAFSANPYIFVPNIKKTYKYYKLFDKLLYEKIKN